MSLRVAIAFVLTLSAAAASAQLYRWTDEKGRVHITDTPPPASARNVQRISGAGNTAIPAQTPYELTQAMENFPVTLYTSPSCEEPCASARSVLNRRGVPFKEVLVWDQTSNEELKRVSGATDVPTLVVGRSVQVGFEQGAFDALLDSARYPKAGTVPARSQGAPPPPEGYASQGERKPPPVAEPVPPAEPEAPPGPYAPRPPRPGGR
jgi:glutaredoxin